MGWLYYGADRLKIRIDDVTLAYLRAVTVSKLRRNEPFLITWRDADDIGDGRSSVWINVTSDLHFRFDGGKPPELSRDRVETMTSQASSNTGLDLSQTPTTLTQSPHSR